MIGPAMIMVGSGVAIGAWAKNKRDQYTEERIGYNRMFQDLNILHNGVTPEFQKKYNVGESRVLEFKIEASSKSRIEFVEKIIASREAMEKEYFQGRELTIDTLQDGKLKIFLKRRIRYWGT